MHNLFKRQWNVTLYIYIHKRHFHPQCSQQYIIWPICCHGVYGEVGNIDKKSAAVSMDADALIIFVLSDDMP